MYFTVFAVNLSGQTYTTTSDSVLVFPVKPEIGFFWGKMVNMLADLTDHLNFNSSLKEHKWHKTEGSFVLEMVLKMAVFQQTTY